MSILDIFLGMVTGTFEVVSTARSRMVNCPGCGETMERIRRSPPRKPYYMDFAHYCDQCDHEVEADHILPNSGSGRRKD